MHLVNQNKAKQNRVEEFICETRSTCTRGMYYCPACNIHLRMDLLLVSHACDICLKNSQQIVMLSVVALDEEDDVIKFKDHGE